MRLLEAIAANDVLWECLHRLPVLNLPDWYLGAGCLAQTVWNLAHGRPLNDDILDYDLAYFDPDLSEHAEAVVAQRAQNLLADLPVKVEESGTSPYLVSAQVRQCHSAVPIHRGRDRDVADHCECDRRARRWRGDSSVGAIWHDRPIRRRCASQPRSGHAGTIRCEGRAMGCAVAVARRPTLGARHRCRGPTIAVHRRWLTASVSRPRRVRGEDHPSGRLLIRSAPRSCGGCAHSRAGPPPPSSLDGRRR
jgi:hypothetical protein